LFVRRLQGRATDGPRPVIRSEQRRVIQLGKVYSSIRILPGRNIHSLNLTPQCRQMGLAPRPFGGVNQENEPGRSAGKIGHQTREQMALRRVKGTDIRHKNDSPG
jgi:hypothetical protein